MSKVIDVSNGGGDLVILGKTLVLPASSTDGTDLPLDGSIRFNPISNGVEVYSSGNWGSLGSGGGGGSSNPTISQVIGLQAALDAKASTVHVHPVSEVTSLQADLDAKAALVHQHAIADVSNLQSTLDGLQTSVNGKAPLVHIHAVADVTGLQAALDGKAPLVHTHVISDITGLQTILNKTTTEQIGFSIFGQPVGGLVYKIPITFQITFQPNFAGFVGNTSTRPANDYSITVKNNNVVQGSFVINHSTGIWSAGTVLNTGLICNAGDILEFDFPSVADGSINTVSLSLVGQRT